MRFETPVKGLGNKCSGKHNFQQIQSKETSVKAIIDLFKDFLNEAVIKL